MSFRASCVVLSPAREREIPEKLLAALAQKGGVGRKELKRDRVLGVPNVGETERGRRFSPEDPLGGRG